mmetsp:Transcript_35289/g.58974  ORF Transcript_35289/g.58974 Transcript_35289/m.58974 type:complete len:122 (-) Transcript_35289:527-892(-)
MTVGELISILNFAQNVPFASARTPLLSPLLSFDVIHVGLLCIRVAMAARTLVVLFDVDLVYLASLMYSVPYARTRVALLWLRQIKDGYMLYVLEVFQRQGSSVHLTRAEQLQWIHFTPLDS